MGRKKKTEQKVKSAYAKPRLVVHGDLRALTLVKKGSMSDGTRKPSTRASGPNA